MGGICRGNGYIPELADVLALDIVAGDPSVGEKYESI
jgi:hypothetical protein